MRILALDIGTRRIGVAITDDLGVTAQPLETIQVSRGGEHMDRIAALCTKYQVTEVVAGVPLELSGEAGFAARRVRLVLAKVERRVGIAVQEIDERLTSRQAERVLLEADVSRSGRKRVVDKLAASLILQGFLEQRSDPHGE